MRKGEFIRGCWTWSRGDRGRCCKPGWTLKGPRSPRGSPWRRSTPSPGTRLLLTPPWTMTPSSSWMPSTWSLWARKLSMKSAAGCNKQPPGTAGAKVTRCMESRSCFVPGRSVLTIGIGDESAGRSWLTLPTRKCSWPGKRSTTYAPPTKPRILPTARRSRPRSSRSSPPARSPRSHAWDGPCGGGRTRSLPTPATNRANNGPTEALNGIIELHRRLARGFTKPRELPTTNAPGLRRPHPQQTPMSRITLRKQLLCEAVPELGRATEDEDSFHLVIQADSSSGSGLGFRPSNVSTPRSSSHKPTPHRDSTDNSVLPGTTRPRFLPSFPYQPVLRSEHGRHRRARPTRASSRRRRMGDPHRIPRFPTGNFRVEGRRTVGFAAEAAFAAQRRDARRSD